MEEQQLDGSMMGMKGVHAQILSNVISESNDSNHHEYYAACVHVCKHARLARECYADVVVTQ